MIRSFATAHRLLELPDVHRALLAEYDFFPEHSLLYIHWHGHLTAPAIVQGAQASLDLFRELPLPQRLLSNHTVATGDWADAIPWLHYEWLPQLQDLGIRLLAHVVPAAVAASPFRRAPGTDEFVEAMQAALRVQSFRTPLAAWQWAITR